MGTQSLAKEQILFHLLYNVTWLTFGIPNGPGPYSLWTLGIEVVVLLKEHWNSVAKGNLTFVH